MLRRLFSSFPRFPASRQEIPPALWEETLASLPLFDFLGEEARRRLKTVSEDFLREKKFYGAHGLELTDAMLVFVAAQAALPILELGLAAYRGWVGIILYPDAFLIPQNETDEAGVVHEYVEPASGESWEAGPVILSWADVEASGVGYNVVLHEFAHKLDLLNGETDGIPRLHSGISEAEWRQALDAAFADFGARVARAERRPTAFAVEQALAALPLDDYAAEDPGEFFAVASESFFTDPHTLEAAYPAFYRLLARYYRQDTLRPT
jgi:Mlc titration factor MtfA (ptsG expression regulator)